MSRSKWWLRAFSRDCSTISLSVNSRAVCLIRRCSSVRSKSILLLFGSQLGGAPRRVDASFDLLGDAVDRQSLLAQRVTIAQCDSLVLETHMVDRNAERGSDFVLAAIALADRPAQVVLRLHSRAQRAVHLAR